MDENEFFLVLQNGTPIYDHDGDVLIQRFEDGTQFYVAPELLSDIAVDTNNVQNGTENKEDGIEEPSTRRWAKNEIKSLICLYKNYKPKFASSAVKNIKVWQKIAAELGTHSATQCENKFKYLKSKYLLKKDNMNNKSSGARAIYFEYFEEMDEIFSKEPIVKPSLDEAILISIASSSRQNNMMEEQDSEINATNENITDRKRSRKNIKLKETIVELNEINENITDTNNVQNGTENKENGIEEPSTRHWSKSEIKSLVCLYKNYTHMYASSAVKNIKIWRKIAAELGTHSATQCVNKFKYLKSKYLLKKGNINNKSSGARAIHFEYFEEMDEIFSKKPKVKPISIASSSRQNNVMEEQDSEIIATNENITGKRFRKNIQLTETIAELNEILKKSEEDKNKRHAEFMELQKYSINKFTEIMNKILDKM